MGTPASVLPCPGKQSARWLGQEAGRQDSWVWSSWLWERTWSSGKGGAVLTSPEEWGENKSRNVSVPESQHIGSASHFLGLIETIQLHRGWAAAPQVTGGAPKNPSQAETLPLMRGTCCCSLSLSASPPQPPRPMSHEGVSLLSQSQGSPSCLCTRQRRTLSW